MSRTLAGWFAAACVGALIGYFSRGESRPPEADLRAAHPVTGAAAPASSHSQEVSPVAPVLDSSAMAHAARSSPGPDDGVTSPAAKLSQDLKLPGGTLDSKSSSGVPPLDKLLESMSAYCTLDAGAGGQWPHGRIFAHTASWQGGPLEFDAINLVDQTAQLTRHPWTSASENAIPLGVTASHSGLHFSGIKPDGELIAMTVFDALDSEQRHRAVLSLHGTKLDHESAQFYGWCTVR